MKEKGIDELFSSMKQLIDFGYNCSLDVLGNLEEDYENIINKYTSEGWLFYHGQQKDVRPFVANAHCVVLPSWHEGMANSNLESCAMGRPVITSNIHGCLEAVDDGINGFLCEKRNRDSLLETMKSLSTFHTLKKPRWVFIADKKWRLFLIDKSLLNKR